MPDVDVRLGDHARVFITLAIDEIGGKNAVPRPGIDEDVADGHEGFVEFGGNLHDPHPGWDVIIGRQEIILGTGRLLDNNEGVNVRSAFDGVRIGYDKPRGRIDLIAVKPVKINPGAWDDIPNSQITLWGMYASNVRWRRQFMTDVYFLDYDLPGDPPRAGFDYNVETGAGKVVVSSAPVRVPSFTERNRNFRMDMVLAREPNYALYRFENVPILPANPSIARFVGSQPDLEIRWAIHEHFLIVLGGWQTTEP